MTYVKIPDEDSSAASNDARFCTIKVLKMIIHIYTFVQLHVFSQREYNVLDFCDQIY